MWHAVLNNYSKGSVRGDRSNNFNRWAESDSSWRTSCQHQFRYWENVSNSRLTPHKSVVIRSQVSGGGLSFTRSASAAMCGGKPWVLLQVHTKRGITNKVVLVTPCPTLKHCAETCTPLNLLQHQSFSSTVPLPSQFKQKDSQKYATQVMKYSMCLWPYSAQISSAFVGHMSLNSKATHRLVS